MRPIGHLRQKLRTIARILFFTASFNSPVPLFHPSSKVSLRCVPLAQIYTSSCLSVFKEFFVLGRYTNFNRYLEWNDKCAQARGFPSTLASINNAEEQKIVDDLLRRTQETTKVVLTGMRMDMKNVTEVFANEIKKVPYS